MIFSEIYGVYFQAVAAVLSEAVEGTLTAKEARKLVDQVAFTDSRMVIMDALRKQEWPLVDADWKTNLRNDPTRPLTNLERRWLKAVSLDPRFQLFGVTVDGLAGIKPLFAPEDFVVYDRYSDGDPYGDPAYQERFRAILKAIREERLLEITYKGKGTSGDAMTRVLEPVKLEYSEKDDKFRLYANGRKERFTLNLARMTGCRILEGEKQEAWPVRGVREQELAAIVLELRDERNALERALLHFAHFEREAEKLDEKRYRLTIRYDREDETEMLIRVLAFGPMIKAVEPEHFVKRVKERLRRQMRFGAMEPAAEDAKTE